MSEVAQRFHRPPRRWPPAVPTEPVRIAPPPTVAARSSGTLISTLFPIVGGIGILGFALVYGNSAFMLVALGMVALMVVFSLAMRWSQKAGTKRKAAEDSKRYAKYLRELDRELAEAGDLQHGALARLFPAPDRTWSMMLNEEGVWERRPGDPDFLHVRLGTGTVPLDRPVQLDLGFNPLTEYEPMSLKAARKVADYRAALPHEPVVVSIGDIGVLAVTGDRARARAWARALVTQLAAFRAPHDLRVVTAFDPAELDDWEWGKWLPHQRLEQAVPDSGSGAALPALAFARSGAELEALLAPEVGRRTEQLRRLAEAGPGGRDERLIAPELIVLVDGYVPGHDANDVAAFRELLAHARVLKAVVVLLCDAVEREPGHVDARLTMPERGKATFTRSGPGAPVIDDLEPDRADVGMAEAIARTLAPLRLDESGGGERSLAAEVRLTDLLTEAPAGMEELTVPIGVGADGEIVTLDLKQAAEGGMGPHGILIGATGSGKSELLRSIVAGLAARHAPERLSFVLVDFKGGAAFAPLAGLPHVSGLITNLRSDLSLVDRMHAALLGEQERRQALLRAAGDLDDVRAYRQRRAADPSMAPLPDLLVIVDEFAELLAARPEYLDLFVGLGRVGRSLGIHLLLASQRLDEGRLRGLESHLRYRICLRTYSAIESKLVLGTSDAYLLPSLPGLGYLKVDTGVLLQFRAALASGAKRLPADAAAPAPAAEIREFDALAVQPTGPQPGERLDADRTDLDELVDRIARDGRPAHQVWVPPLPATLPLDAVDAGAAWWERDRESTGGLRAAVGELDLPAEQRKAPHVLDFSGAGGHGAVVGAPQTGKSTLLRTLVLALARTHTPDEARFYGIDLGGGRLAALERLPHVGGVAGRLEREAVGRVVRQLVVELEEREELLARHGLGSSAEVRARRAAGRLPEELSARLADTFLIIDGWGAFRSEFEDLEVDVHRLAATGLGLGLHVVVAANRWAEIRPALLDNLGTRLELKLNDALDSLVARRAQEALPGAMPGRGLTRASQTFQAALPRLDGAGTEEGAAPALEMAMDDIAGRWRGPRADPIRLLPPLVEASMLPAAARDAIPLGMDERTLGPVALNLLGRTPHLLAFGDAGAGKSALLRLVAHGLAAAFSPEELRITIADVRRSLTDLAELPHLEAYAAASGAANEAATELVRRLSDRVPGVGTGADVLRAPSWDGPRHVVLVDDYDLLATPASSPLQPLLELLPMGREVGLHVVLVRRVAGSARAAFEPVFSHVRDLGSPGLILDGDPAEGALLGGVKAAHQPPGRALLVRRGERPQTVQIAYAAAPSSAPIGHPFES